VTEDSATAAPLADNERAASNDKPPTAGTKRLSEGGSIIVCANASIGCAGLA